MSKACNVSVPILLRRNTKEIKSLVQHYQWVRAEPSSKPRQSGFWAQSLGNLAEFHWSSGNLEAAGYLLAPAGSRLVLGMEEVKGSGSLAGWAHRILRGSAFSCYWLNCSRNCAFRAHLGWTISSKKGSSRSQRAEFFFFFKFWKKVEYWLISNT